MENYAKILKLIFAITFVILSFCSLIWYIATDNKPIALIIFTLIFGICLAIVEIAFYNTYTNKEKEWTTPILATIALSITILLLQIIF